MGRLNQGPNGPFSGKTGSVIGSSWKGIFYIKSLQKKSLKPRSPRQIEYQDRFAFAVKFLHPIKRLLNMGFSKVNPKGATGYNMALSYILQNSIKGSHPNFEIDYPAVRFTQGKLHLPQVVNIERIGLSIKVTWSTETDNYGSFTDDDMMLLTYQAETGFFIEYTSDSMRKDGKTEIKIAPEDNDRNFHVFLYLIKRDGKIWSNSMYLGHALWG